MLLIICYDLNVELSVQKGKHKFYKKKLHKIRHLIE